MIRALQPWPFLSVGSLAVPSSRGVQLPPRRLADLTPSIDKFPRF
jgi:hypothetical protein